MELIVDDQPVIPPPAPSPSPESPTRIRIDYHEQELRDRVKVLGGKWLPDEKCWLIAWQHVESEGLLDRVQRP